MQTIPNRLPLALLAALGCVAGSASAAAAPLPAAAFQNPATDAEIQAYLVREIGEIRTEYRERRGEARRSKALAERINNPILIHEAERVEQENDADFARKMTKLRTTYGDDPVDRALVIVEAAEARAREKRKEAPLPGPLPGPLPAPLPRPETGPAPAPKPAPGPLPAPGPRPETAPAPRRLPPVVDDGGAYDADRAERLLKLRNDYEEKFLEMDHEYAEKTLEAR
ncbi:MAG TPA: hypothetical protein VGC54_10030, partial [Planctomycetota bacterium]